MMKWPSLSSPSELDEVKAESNKPKFSRFKPALCLSPFAIFFYLFQIAPMLWVIVNSFKVDDEWSLDNYGQIIDSPFIQQGFSHSASISFWSSLVGLVIATLLVNSLRRIPGRLRSAVVAFTNMTSNFAGVPLAFAFIIILGANGAVTLLLKQWGVIDDFNIYSQWGLLLIYIYFQIPLAALLLYPAFDALDDDWQSAAALLGASHWQYWRNVAIPVLAPALLGTFIILIANAMGAYASVYALTGGNYNMITIRIASLVAGDLFLEPNLAAAISVVLIVLLACITAINQWLIARSYHGKH
ncbi:ABC transporter permease subunit [Vibrio porteresiae DSM 19223]|uniref:ABC transporter permease subunit n=2 Tax=Vibrionaceae TaxID=641 RepID=A0ABZ0QK43_9VIBR|nr:ABC transporter permease subunit [Vibrio porteresiae]WPC76840.1 ABC transporter permease subunit [Vibrio porteresiae DSM 19223]